MGGKFYIGTDAGEFKKVLGALSDEGARVNRKDRIIQKYTGKYNLDGEVATVQGKRVHIDYLPTIDAMLETKARYKHSQEVVGAALFKIEKDQSIYLTNSDDPNLQRVYEAHQREADELADKLWKINTEEFNYQWTHELAIVLSSSFTTVFGQTCGDWRRSLSNSAL